MRACAAFFSYFPAMQEEFVLPCRRLRAWILHWVRPQTLTLFIKAIIISREVNPVRLHQAPDLQQCSHKRCSSCVWVNKDLIEILLLHFYIWHCVYSHSGLMKIPPPPSPPDGLWISIVWLMRLSNRRRGAEWWDKTGAWVFPRLVSPAAARNVRMCVCVARLCVNLYCQNIRCPHLAISTKLPSRTLNGLQSKPNYYCQRYLKSSHCGFKLCIQGAYIHIRWMVE